MGEVETKQYCVTVKVWVWAENLTDAEKVVIDDMNYLCGLDTPIAGFGVDNVSEDTEV
jgi:hypothetical protein